jgi:hypothetical protein
MNIDDMQAGPEMDRLVAEATGWARWQTVNGRNAFPVATDTLHDEWQPSTNIAHAFEVAEKIREIPCYFQLEDHDIDGRDGRAWVCRIGASLFLPAIVGIGETAPLAICRASLKAVRG